MRAFVLGVCLFGAAGACGDDGVSTEPMTFGTIGPLAGDAGRGSFRFGAASAATQIEDMNPRTDWWAWTAPEDQGGLGKGAAFVGDAVKGYTKALDDVQLVEDMGLDSYRFSIEWARIEPKRDEIDEAAIAHYREELEALAARGIRPLVTLHHFSNPVWVADPRDIACAAGPTDDNLCGLGHPTGGPLIIDEMAEHAALIAQRFGDLVDEWGTVNEPVNYLFASYGVGIFPPGRMTIFAIESDFVPVLRDYVEAHVRMYDAIKANDTIDADGDGMAAVVGLSLSVADWQPARANVRSSHPDDLAARDRLVYFFHYAMVDALESGMFDADLDGSGEEPHPSWAGKLDWLGLQYYFRAGVTAATAILPAPVGLTPCLNAIDLGACLTTPDPTFCVPQMGYEFWPDGLRTILIDFKLRYPALPFVVTEAGIATDVGARRAENIVRVLEAIARARDENGVDVRGYYHWSLTDNFEWAEGFAPHFGLYRVDYTTYDRTPTEGADVLGAIAKARTLTTQQRARYGGLGPMTPDTVTTDAFCSQVK